MMDNTSKMIKKLPGAKPGFLFIILFSLERTPETVKVYSVGNLTPARYFCFSFRMICIISDARGERAKYQENAREKRTRVMMLIRNREWDDVEKELPRNA